MERRRFLLNGILSLASLAAAHSLPAAADETVKLRDLYEKDLSFSPLAKSLSGQQVNVAGYMAPPLKADARFFVLTRRPMAVCPFCETEADWPRDILAVYTKRVLRVVPFNAPIIAGGVLELGTYKDQDTGFVSRVRLLNAAISRS